MRLFLAVAVLMLAFVAYTEAQGDAWETVGQKFNEMGSNLAEKWKELSQSDAANNMKGWVSETMDSFTKLFKSQ
ncbi:unnamed protein product [Ophioblennius macclurei]